MQMMAFSAFWCEILTEVVETHSVSSRYLFKLSNQLRQHFIRLVQSYQKHSYFFLLRSFTYLLTAQTVTCFVSLYTFGQSDDRLKWQVLTTVIASAD